MKTSKILTILFILTLLTTFLLVLFPTVFIPQSSEKTVTSLNGCTILLLFLSTCLVGLIKLISSVK